MDGPDKTNKFGNSVMLLKQLRLLFTLSSTTLLQNDQNYITL